MRLTLPAGAALVFGGSGGIGREVALDLARVGSAVAVVHHRDEQVRALVPLRRWGQPSDIGAACVFLASEQAGYVSGQQLSVAGGFGGFGV